MKSIITKVLASLSILLLVGIQSVTAQEKTIVSQWSPPVNGLKARAVLSSPVIGKTGETAVWIELINVGDRDLRLDPGNPFWETANLIDSDKKTVKPLTEVSPLRLSTNNAILPKGCYLGFSASDRHYPPMNAQVAVGIFAWEKLKPGKYSLHVTYSVVPSGESVANQQAALANGEWRGTLLIPPIQLEITDK